MNDIERLQLVDALAERDRWERIAASRLELIDRLLMVASPRTLIGCHCPPGQPHDSLCVLKPVDEPGWDTTFLGSTS